MKSQRFNYFKLWLIIKDVLIVHVQLVSVFSKRKEALEL